MHRLALAVVLLAGCHRAAVPATTTPPTTTDDVPTNTTDGGPAVALAVVYEAHNVWMGNDSYVSPDEGGAPGFDEALFSSLGELTAVGGAGSTGVFIAYGRGASVVQRADDLHAFDAGTLAADQEAFSQVFTRDLLAGLALAHDELAKQTAPRKVLIVIGDGLDTVVDSDLAGFAAALREAGIETYAVFAPTELLDGSSANMDAIGTSGSYAVESSFAEVFGEIVAKVNAP